MENNKLHICAMSDLHGKLPQEVPPCDVVCICGDIAPLDFQCNTLKCVIWFLQDFTPWAESLNCDKVIFIGGNHDFFLQHLSSNDAYEVMRTLFPGVHFMKHNKLVYLLDNSYEYKGKKFYGTPWISNLVNWAFYADDNYRKNHFEHIPKNCDVLLTHQPPLQNDCGMVLQSNSFNHLSNYGDNILSDIIDNRNIKWVLSGHVHSGNHIPKEINNTNFVNVSIKDEDYKVKYDIFEFDV